MRGRVSKIEIPSWMDQLTPGAAQAARLISRGNLSDLQRQRLARLTSDATKRAWLEPGRQRQKSKRKLTKRQLWAGHHELMWEAYRAADFQPIGRPEIEQSKANLAAISTDAAKLARDIREVGNDGQLAGLWLVYRNNRRDDAFLQRLPDDLPSAAQVIDRVADFFWQATTHHKPEGPVPPVGHAHHRDALKTTVIRQIAQTCQRHFGTILYSTVATLAKASLDRTDIDRESVRGSLRNKSRTMA
jgi:hypothetical protein